MDLNGYAACCRNASDCTILENKETLASQLLEIALAYNFSGFSMDWEFGESFHWAGFNETMSHVAGVLRPHGLGLGLSINSDCNAASPSPGGGGMDPSCDPDFRDTPWASILSDMGTYVIGDLNATWSKNGTRGTCPATCVKHHTHKNDWVCTNKHDPEVMPCKCSSAPFSPSSSEASKKLPAAQTAATKAASSTCCTRRSPQYTPTAGHSTRQQCGSAGAIQTVPASSVGHTRSSKPTWSSWIRSASHGSGFGARTHARFRIFRTRWTAETISWALLAPA